MYKVLGKFGNICLRSISYTEDKLEDKRLGYKWAFDLELLPSIKLSNHERRISVTLRWLAWEVIIVNFKQVQL